VSYCIHETFLSWDGVTKANFIMYLYSRQLSFAVIAELKCEKIDSVLLSLPPTSAEADVNFRRVKYSDMKVRFNKFLTDYYLYCKRLFSLSCLWHLTSETDTWQEHLTMSNLLFSFQDVWLSLENLCEKRLIDSLGVCDFDAESLQALHENAKVSWNTCAFNVVYFS